MKKFLSIIFSTLLFCNVAYAEDYKWEISTISDGQIVLASMNGNVTHGDTLMLILKNSNQGKCDYVQPTFSFYTMAKNPAIKKIQGKEIPIKTSDGNTYADASLVSPFLLGHRVMFSMSFYKVDDLINSLSKYKSYDVVIVDETNPKSVGQSNRIENFKATDYFDIINNNWNLKGAKEAILKAQKLCLKYKVTKKNITESKQGTYTTSGGSKYVGETKGGIPHGQGTYTYANGHKYVGEWKDGNKNGQGTYTFPDGQKHVGEWKDGKTNGQGTWTWPDGNKYVGNYKDGKQNGQGTITYLDGTKYVGEWKDGKKNGQGIAIYPNSGRYVGEWKDDKRHGQGIHTTPGVGKYDGEFKNDKIHGQGTSTEADGSRYVGEFKDNNFNGQGTHTTSDGLKYVGYFKDGKRSGQGDLIFPDGEKYHGDWKDELVSDNVSKEVKDGNLSKEAKDDGLSEEAKQFFEDHNKKKIVADEKKWIGDSMSIYFWGTVIIILYLGFGYLGIYVFKQNPKFKIYLTTKNVVVISLAYIVLVSFISGKNVAFGVGAFLTPYLITVINSLYRNKLKFKKTFDQKFYPFFIGLLFVGFVSTIISSIF